MRIFFFVNWLEYQTKEGQGSLFRILRILCSDKRDTSVRWSMNFLKRMFLSLYCRFPANAGRSLRELSANPPKEFDLTCMRLLIVLRLSSVFLYCYKSFSLQANC